ncbi:regulatory signaling modulator protein AmpE [Lysobacter sp. A289]
MSIALIATVVALVLGHLAPSFAAAVRQHAWYGDLAGWLNGRFGEQTFWRSRWGIVLALAPGLLIVGLLQLSLEGRLAGIAELLFGVAMLFYAWGPRDLDRDVGAVLDATDSTARRDAIANLTGMETDAPVDGAGLVEPVFRSAVRRWFGVLFWFLVLGPFGAVLYRLSVLSAVGDIAARVPDQTRRGARTWLAVLEWPVAQLVTLSLALVGNFDSVLDAWRSGGGASARLDNRFLGAAARASVRSELAEDASDGAALDYPAAGIDGDADAAGPGVAALPELHDAMSLVWRCLLVWLAALALFVIAGFVS